MTFPAAYVISSSASLVSRPEILFDLQLYSLRPRINSNATVFRQLHKPLDFPRDTECDR